MLKYRVYYSITACIIKNDVELTPRRLKDLAILFYTGLDGCSGCSQSDDKYAMMSELQSDTRYDFYGHCNCGNGWCIHVERLTDILKSILSVEYPIDLNKWGWGDYDDDAELEDELNKYIDSVDRAKIDAFAHKKDATIDDALDVLIKMCYVHLPLKDNRYIVHPIAHELSDKFHIDSSIIKQIINAYRKKEVSEKYIEEYVRGRNVWVCGGFDSKRLDITSEEEEETAD